MATKKAKSRTSRKDEKLKKALRKFVRARGAEFLEDRNVTSIGVGRKNDDGEISLVFTVGQKAEAAQLESLDTKELPKTIEVDGIEVQTDVIERNYQASYKLVQPETPDVRKVRLDPMVPGVSVSHVEGTAGTLGAVVYDASTGAPCILSNWHVLHGNDGDIGDEIVQPGPFDNNDITDNECGELLRSHLGAAGDCALAQIRGRAFDAQILDLGVVPSQMAEVDLDDAVVKSGRTTKKTYGLVRRTDVMVKINYGFPTGQVAIGGFEIGIDPDRRPGNGEISMGGDSGAAWMIADGDEATGIFAGLHFAGENSLDPDEHALACYPKSVQRKLDFVLKEPPGFQVADDEDSGGARRGFDPSFLGLRAPMPKMSLAIKRDAVNFGDAQTIPYTHFSVCLSAKRRLARFVAWNVDGAQKVVLGSHGFKLDSRLDADLQSDNALYEHNNLDRGHIARRADLAWGPVDEAKQANRDSYFYTNIAPQHERFNQSGRGGIWGKLENTILEQAATLDIRISVLGGPIFRDDDPKYRGTQIPREFWKLIAYRAADGGLSSVSFVLSQSNLLQDIETLDLDPFRLYQVSVPDLTDRTTLDFSAYSDADVLQNPERALRGTEGTVETPGQTLDVKEITEDEQIVF